MTSTILFVQSARWMNWLMIQSQLGGVTWASRSSPIERAMVANARCINVGSIDRSAR